MTARRLATLRAALGFLELLPRAPELRLLHGWLDGWLGVGLITAGVERLGYRLSLSHIAEGEWRAVPMFDGLPLLCYSPAAFHRASGRRCGRRTLWHLARLGPHFSRTRVGLRAEVSGGVSRWDSCTCERRDSCT
jgi:hypothetical protein